MIKTPSVVISDLDVADAAVFPTKAGAPLIVDSDAPLAGGAVSG